jgi:hypothetical protein
LTRNDNVNGSLTADPSPPRPRTSRYCNPLSSDLHPKQPIWMGFICLLTGPQPTFQPLVLSCMQALIITNPLPHFLASPPRLSTPPAEDPSLLTVIHIFFQSLVRISSKPCSEPSGIKQNLRRAAAPSNHVVCTIRGACTIFPPSIAPSCLNTPDVHRNCEPHVSLPNPCICIPDGVVENRARPHSRVASAYRRDRHHHPTAFSSLIIARVLESVLHRASGRP